MATVDIIQSLKDLGVGENEAQDLKVRLSGGDLINLVNALAKEDLGQSYSEASAILGKYGIKLGGSSEMHESDEYLKAMFEGFKNNTSEVDIIINEWLKPITEESHADARFLALEGFDYYTQVDESSGEKLIDWLDSNQVEFLTDGKGHFHIKCGDRASAYKVGRALSEIMKKATVRDSVESEVQEMAKKPSLNKRINQAKDKLAKITPRDPSKQDAMSRKNAGFFGDQNPHKVIDRKAKYKPRYDEEIDYQAGDAVMVGEQQGTVKIPHGPNGTIGVMIDGELSMVSENEVSRLDEAVLGMAQVNPLFRLRELAGLAPAPMVSPEDEAMSDDLDGIDVVDPESLQDMPAVDATDATDADLDTGLDSDIDGNLDGDLGAAPVAPVPDAVDISAEPAGVPGDLPPMNPEVTGVPVQSSAMSQIEDALNNIQVQLADIRLGEYKTVIRKLQDLTNQVQMMGRDYLGERRMKK